MKNIGILTYHSVCNFGANLQALSTFSFLKKNGYNPIFINWMPKDLDDAFKNTIPVQQFKQHEDYWMKHYVLTERCYTDKDVANAIIKNNIEAIIVGSDAVCQHHTLLSRLIFPCKTIINFARITSDRLCPNPFWGSFQKLLPHKIPMAMMSASSQNSSYKILTKREKDCLREHLKNFVYLSVRDEWTANMFKYVTNGDVTPNITPDPVFAFNYNVNDIPSKDFILKKFNLPDQYYLLSFHDSRTVSIEWLQEFENLALKKRIKCVALAFPNGIKFRHPFDKQIDLPLDPIDWYALIKYASGYIGHNMHPIVVSLHNSIPCFSFDNYGVTKLRIFVNEKSSKIYHIMDRFNLLLNRVSSKNILYKVPKPGYVLDKLLSYETIKVSKVSENIYMEYESMMKNILKAFAENE